MMRTKILNLLMLILTLSLVTLTSCKTDDPDDPINNEGKPSIENLTLTPASNLKYGDNINISATFTDEVGLRSYTIQISDITGVIFEKTEMLTGKTFALNLDIPIPLPKNAVAGDINITVTLKNSGNQLATEEKVINNVALPQFENLYLIIGNTAYTMTKNGNVFEMEDFIPPLSFGKIYSNPNKTGLYWGMSGTEIKVLGADDIQINGSDAEEFIKITFNPVSFELTVGESQTWTPISDAYYILGNISGHWADGEISDERPKMKMQGSSLGVRKMWSWTPPNTGTGDPIDDMWGNIKPGTFRFKKAGSNEFVTYDGTNIVISGSDNKDNSFVVTAGGPFTIKLFSEDGTTISSVRLEDGTKTLEYTNDGIYINGTKATNSITFAGAPLSIMPGNFYVYEGTISLTKDQSITSPDVNLATAFCDPDAFDGKGNTIWTFKQPDGTYYVRIDIFSGDIYIRSEAGYPSAIYMDGWSWGKYEGQEIVWNPNSRLTLYRVGTSNKYSGTLYIYPWGGDISFFAAPPTVEDYSSQQIFAKYFDGVTLVGTNMLFPSGLEGYYKITVDLKDGFTFDKEQKEPGTENYLLIPTNGKKFTIAFDAIDY